MLEIVDDRIDSQLINVKDIDMYTNDLYKNKKNLIIRSATLKKLSSIGLAASVILMSKMPINQNIQKKVAFISSTK